MNLGQIDLRRLKLQIGVLLGVLLLPALSHASAVQVTRSQIDRADDVSGYQVHLVYVVPNGSTDLNVDTNGQIDSWVKEGNAWLNEKVNRRLQIDTFQGITDVTFLSSKYRVSELCRDNCNTLSSLKEEYVAQNPTFDNSKTLLFMMSEKLDPSTCGWADYASNLALTHGFGITNGGCNWVSSKVKTGLDGPAKSIIHELIHTFGIHHVCMDNSDLMIGIPECKIDNDSYGKIQLTLDSKRNQYIGSDLAFGIDLLKMPIWSDGSGTKSYAEIKQVSDTKYLPLLVSKNVAYAVVGKQSEIFSWGWEKNFYPDWAGVKCQFTSGLVTVIGTQNKSGCVFDVPNTLRASKPFTVTQSWVKGPWYGEASTTGVLVRSDYSSDPCLANTCFVGGATTAASSCWTSDVNSMTLQQLLNGKWVDFKTVGTNSGSKCLNNGKYVNYPELTLNFQQSGVFVYRWFVPSHPGFNSYTDTPFAVIVNDENSAEPSQDEIASAQANAIELGKAADALAAQLAAAKVADLKKSTITCVKGKLTKKITATNPKCPAGYKKK